MFCWNEWLNSFGYKDKGHFDSPAWILGVLRWLSLWRCQEASPMMCRAPIRNSHSSHSTIIDLSRDAYKGWSPTTPSPHGCMKQLRRETEACKRGSASWGMRALRSSTPKQYTLTYYTNTWKILFRLQISKERLKLNWEFVPSRLETPRPQPLLIPLVGSLYLQVIYRNRKIYLDMIST